ncbi:MAG: hypothetical protein ACT4P1_02810 [Sporichthyaceae bacterium]
MASKRKPTHAERRAAQPAAAGARVYGLEIEDAGADSWLSRIVYFADSSDSADERRRSLGVHNRVIKALLTDSAIPEEAHRLATMNPTASFLSQFNDDGWSPWFALPPGYEHPSQGKAAKQPALRLIAPGPGETTWRRRQL